MGVHALLKCMVVTNGPQNRIDLKSMYDVCYSYSHHVPGTIVIVIVIVIATRVQLVVLYTCTMCTE
jgi:hypothetical protein